MTCLRPSSIYFGVFLLVAATGVPARAQRDARATAAAPVGANEVVVTVVSDDQGGRAVRRVSVSLQAGEIIAPRTVMTDDEGRAVFRGIAAGNYVVTAFKPGYVRTYYGAKTPWRGPGVAVAVFDGKPVPNVRLKLIRGGVITGVVRTLGGRPAVNRNVTATSDRMLQNQSLQDLSESMVNQATTDDRGVYRIYGLAPGTYMVSVVAAGQREETRQVTPDELRWADNASAAPTSDLSAPPPASPSEAYAPVYHPGTAVISDATPVTIEPGQERAGVDIRLQLVPTARITGRVVDDQGRPQANASISLRGTSNVATPIDIEFIASLASGSSRTAADGSFTLTSVRPGRYTASVQATIRGASEPPLNAQAQAMASAAEALSGIFGGAGGTHYASEEVTVAGRDITDLILVLRPSLAVTGKVIYEATTLAAPKDLSTVRLSLAPIDAAMNGMSSMVQSMLGGLLGSGVTVAADGTFAARGLSPGKYRLQTPAEAMAMLTPITTPVEGGWTLKSVMVGGRDVADSGIELKQQDVSGAVVTFTDHPAELSGTVFDQAGRITPDFPIVVFTTDRLSWVSGSRRVRQARPASDGRFRIVGLPAGEYFVCAVTGIEQNELNDPMFLEQLVPSSFKISLKDGEKKTQDLKLGGG